MPTEVWSTVPARLEPASDAQKETALALDIPWNARFGIVPIQVATTNGASDPLLFVLVDSLSTVTNAATNTTLSSAQRLTPPIAVDGTSAEVTSHFFSITAKRQQRIAIEVVAARLGSTMDPLLRVLDTKGHELAYNEDHPRLGADARIDFAPSKSGKYLLEVRDTRYQGGPKSFYRLRVGDFPVERLSVVGNVSASAVGERRSLPQQREAEPNDSAQHATRFTIPASLIGNFAKSRDRDLYAFEAQEGQRLAISAKTRSIGSAGDISLQLLKADGAAVAELNASTSDEGSFSHKFTTSGTHLLLAEELTEQGGAGFDYRIDVQPVMPGFVLTAETNNVRASPGGTFDLKITAARREYDGPITLAFSDSIFVLTNNVIPAKTNTTQIKATVPTNLISGKLIHFHAIGRAQTNDVALEAIATTMPGLRKSFPNLLYPPSELDGLIALGIIPATTQPEKKKTTDSQAR